MYISQEAKSLSGDWTRSSNGLSQAIQQQAIGIGHQAPAEPGIASALQILEEVVSALSVNASEIENVLGLSNPEPAGVGVCDPGYTPRIVTRLQDLRSTVESANHRLNKSLNHLRS